MGDDVGLVAAVLRRDRKATAEFVDRYSDHIYGYVRSRLAPRYEHVGGFGTRHFSVRGRISAIIARRAPYRLGSWELLGTRWRTTIAQGCVCRNPLKRLI